MAAHDRRPVIRGSDDAWQRLGELLQLRRAELGYRRRPAFTRERGINIRLVTDIENAYRPNTFLTPTLREIAQAYAVTYDSMVAVLLGHDDELIPVPPGVPAAPSSLFREEAARPYVGPIFARLEFLTEVRHIEEPTGEQMTAEPDGTRITRIDGTPLMDDYDIAIFNGSRGAMSDPDRVWLVGDLHTRREPPGPASRTSSA